MEAPWPALLGDGTLLRVAAPVCRFLGEGNWDFAHWFLSTATSWWNHGSPWGISQFILDHTDDPLLDSPEKSPGCPKNSNGLASGNRTEQFAMENGRIFRVDLPPWNPWWCYIPSFFCMFTRPGIIIVPIEMAINGGTPSSLDGFCERENPNLETDDDLGGSPISGNHSFPMNWK